MESYIYEPKISPIFNIDGGNGGLTEEFIYNHQPTTIEESISILSSATNEANLMGHVYRYSKPKGKNLKISDAPAILVARNGYAGTMTYISTENLLLMIMLMF